MLRAIGVQVTGDVETTPETVAGSLPRAGGIGI
jgi:hypothetical protein